jgi:hypothetical protein
MVPFKLLPIKYDRFVIIGPGRDVLTAIREGMSHSESQDFFFISSSIKPMKTKPPPRASKLDFRKRKKMSLIMTGPPL